jgi:hypothetical protein
MISGNVVSPPVWIEFWEKKGDFIGRAQLQIDLNQPATVWIKLEAKEGKYGC